MSEVIIKPVSDNMDKMLTYRNMMVKHRIAMNQKFYFEAIMIEYAMLEDRLASFLYHVGVLTPKNGKLKFSSNDTKLFVQNILENYVLKKPPERIDLKNISTKINIVRGLIFFASDSLVEKEHNKYYSTLAAVFKERLDLQALQETLNKITEWCRCRNEMVHSMLNKSFTDLIDYASPKAKDGIVYARYIDKCVDAVKGRNKIRRSANLVIL